MRRHRKWLMGFGIGVIFGASMLQLILFAQELENNQTLELSNAPKTYTQEELDAAVAKALEDARGKPANADLGEPGEVPSAGTNANDAPDARTSEGTAASADASTVQTESDAKIVSFYIHSGMDLTTVARSLKRLGLIEDVEDFIEEARPFSKEIQPGTSIFAGSPNDQEIIAELTRPKED